MIVRIFLPISIGGLVAFAGAMLVFVLVPATARSQSLDRIERERALSMLSIVKSDL